VYTAQRDDCVNSKCVRERWYCGYYLAKVGQRVGTLSPSCLACALHYCYASHPDNHVCQLENLRRVPVGMSLLRVASLPRSTMLSSCASDGLSVPLLLPLLLLLLLSVVLTGTLPVSLLLAAHSSKLCFGSLLSFVVPVRLFMYRATLLRQLLTCADASRVRVATAT
jgi:hypothetical protein